MGGCYSMAHIEDPIAAEQGIECEYDSFAKTNICTGRHIVTKAADLTSPSANWTFPRQVIDSNGQKFATTQIDSQIPMCYSGICTTWEYIGINLNMNYLRQHAQTGFSMKTYGIRGNIVINIPAAYIQGFLNFINNNKGL